MYVFGEINKSSTVIESNIVHYTHNLTTASLGIQSVKIVSGSISSSYWESLNVLFYTSGSTQYAGEEKFSAPSSNLSLLFVLIHLMNLIQMLDYLKSSYVLI